MSAQHPSNQDRGEPEELAYEHMLRLLAMDREWEKHYNERLAHSRVFALVLFAGIAFGIQRINWVVGSWWVTLLAVLATGVAASCAFRLLHWSIRAGRAGLCTPDDRSFLLDYAEKNEYPARDALRKRLNLELARNLRENSNRRRELCDEAVNGSVWLILSSIVGAAYVYFAVALGPLMLSQHISTQSDIDAAAETTSEANIPRVDVTANDS